jgi:hypothetical protein
MCGVLSSLNGLIAFLSRQCGGKVYRWELVEITGSRNCHAVKHGTNLARDSVFQWAGRLTLSIHFDFKTMKVTPASNAIRAGSAGNNHLKSSVGEVWSDGKDLRPLDKGLDEPHLNREGTVATLSLLRSSGSA